MIKRRESARRYSRNTWLILFVAGILSGCVFWRWAENTAYALTLVVNTTADSDDGTCSSAVSGCTLREAINFANAIPGDDTINFNIPGAGVHTIQLKSDLPAITGPLTINGYSQPVASPNTLADGNNAVLLIELSGGYSEECCLEKGLQLGTGNTVRGLIINRFNGEGISVHFGDNLIQGNFIGTDPTGTLARGNNVGVFSISADILIGGTSPGDRNVISGNRQEGVHMTANNPPVGTQVRNNYIGTAADGKAPLGNGHGLFLFGASHTDVRDNVIAFNDEEGILVSLASTDNTFLSNSIHSNGGLGIDLVGGAEDSLGVTANDAGDADTGPNNLQNFPVITSATTSGMSTTVTITLNSTPNTIFEGHLYTNTSCDTSGHGEGMDRSPIVFALITDASGNATTTGSFGIGAGEGPFLTSTVTGPDGTSEFSKCVAAVASTLTVNTTADTDDGACNAAHCSLREAINSANATTIADAINFNIPGAGVQTIALTSPLPPIVGRVIIDGYTQPGSSPNTLPLPDGVVAVPLIEINGAGAGPMANGLELVFGSSIVRGLIINRFSSGAGIHVLGDGNVVAGNFIGTDQGGASALGNQTGVFVDNSRDNRIGGLLPADRNLISGNLESGIYFQGLGSTGNVALGNLIGTDRAGTNRVGNKTGVQGETLLLGGSIIGGTEPGARNVISGNSTGVLLSDTANQRVLGNFIGTDATGQRDLGNSLAGVRLSKNIDTALSNIIGGDFGGDNVIAFNGGDGVSVEAGNGNLIGRNSIHSNGGLGIDLVGGTEDSFGVTANDTGDADTGPNNLQNFPVLNLALTSGGKTTVLGTLNSTPNTILRITYYSSPSCDPSGHGEGRNPIFEELLSTGPTGSISFSTVLSNLSFSGPFITATATDPNGNTSEFSPCVEAPPSSTFQFGTSSLSVQEDCTEVVFTVSRVGLTSDFGAKPATVEYGTQSGTASDRSDFTTARGTLRFEVGETAKTISVLISEDSFAEGTEMATITLSNAIGAGLGTPATATLEILDDSPEQTVNPVDVAEQFVCQHYNDFFNRQHDVEGLNFWTNEIESCGTDAQCREVKRVNVSGAFFLSIEFQETGFFAIRIQRTASGSKSDAMTRITYNHFIEESRQVGEGVVVGTPNWEQQLEANRLAYAKQVVASVEFVAKYPITLLADQYVDALFASAMITPTTVEREAASTAFGAGGSVGRVAALRKVADSDSLRTAEFRPAFVLMQYFGYLRRDPDEPGYQFWLAKLNQFNGDFVQAEMVRAFISSTEYRERFGQP